MRGETPRLPCFCPYGGMNRTHRLATMTPRVRNRIRLIQEISVLMIAISENGDPSGKAT